MPPIPAMQEAAHSLIAEQCQSTAIPKRFTIPIREIWDMQERLPRRQGKRADTGDAAFPTRRVNGGGWVRPASDFAFDGSSRDGTTFGTGSNVTKAINATNGESNETAPFGSAPYGKEGGGEPYAFHPAGINVVLGDGSVKFINETVTIRVFSSLVTRAGSETIDRKSAGL